jgi:hypothetical protein
VTTESAPELLLARAVPCLTALDIATQRTLVEELGNSEDGGAVLPPAGVARLLPRVVEELVFGRFGEMPFEDMCPALTALEGAVEFTDLSARGRNALIRSRRQDWADLRTVTPSQLLGIRNIGRKTAHEIAQLVLIEGFRAAVRESPSEGGAARPGPSPRSSGTQAVGDEAEAIIRSLKVIAAWAATEHGVEDLEKAVLLMEVAADLPGEVETSRRALHRIDVHRFGANQTAMFDAQRAAADFLELLGPAAVDILVSRVWSLGRRPTLQALGAKYRGVTRERVRQIEARAVRRASGDLHRRQYAVLRRAARRLRAAIGVAAPISDVYELRELRRVAPASGESDPAVLLMLWLAGPYELRDDWLVLKPAATTVDATRGLVRACMPEGFCEIPAVAERLIDAGFTSSSSQRWLQEVLGIRLIHGKAVDWSGTIPDKARIVLALRGEPMTYEDIMAELGDGSSPRSLANRVAADPRFKRTGISMVGLRHWDFDEYTTISDEIAEEIGRQGGEATLQHLVAKLSQTYGVSEASVRAYAGSERFERTSRATVRVRERRGSPSLPASPSKAELTRTVFRCPSGWRWRTTVDSGTLRGSGRTIPTALARVLSVSPGGRRKFESPAGTLSVSWPSLHPTIGSLRPAAELTGAEIGDYLFVELLDDGRSSFAAASQETLSTLRGQQRLAAEIGLDPATVGRRWVEEIGLALGIPAGAAESIAAVRRRLLARGDTDLERLLPHQRENQPKDYLSDLLAALTDEPAARDDSSA